MGIVKLIRFWLSNFAVTGRSILIELDTGKPARGGEFLSNA